MYLAIAARSWSWRASRAWACSSTAARKGFWACPAACSPRWRQDVTAVWAQMQAESERYLGNAQGSATRTAALYFPSTDGDWLLPEAREVTFAREGLVAALVGQLCAGPASLTCASAVSPTGSVLAGEPALTVTDAGERVLQLNLSSEALSAAEAAGVRTWQVCGRPDADASARFSRSWTPCVSAPTARRSPSRRWARKRASCAAATSAAASAAPRASIWPTAMGRSSCARPPSRRARPARPARCWKRCFSPETAAALGGASPVPEALDEMDILGVRVRDGVATVNLSARFYSACQELDEAARAHGGLRHRQHALRPHGVDGVRFLIEGEQVETLSEYIYMRTVLLPKLRRRGDGMRKTQQKGRPHTRGGGPVLSCRAHSATSACRSRSQVFTCQR